MLQKFVSLYRLLGRRRRHPPRDGPQDGKQWTKSAPRPFGVGAPQKAAPIGGSGSFFCRAWSTAELVHLVCFRRALALRWYTSHPSLSGIGLREKTHIRENQATKLLVMVLRPKAAYVWREKCINKTHGLHFFPGPSGSDLAGVVKSLCWKSSLPFWLPKEGPPREEQSSSQE